MVACLWSQGSHDTEHLWAALQASQLPWKAGGFPSYRENRDLDHLCRRQCHQAATQEREACTN